MTKYDKSDKNPQVWQNVTRGTYVTNMTNMTSMTNKTSLANLRSMMKQVWQNITCMMKNEKGENCDTFNYKW